MIDNLNTHKRLNREINIMYNDLFIQAKNKLQSNDNDAREVLQYVFANEILPKVDKKILLYNDLLDKGTLKNYIAKILDINCRKVGSRYFKHKKKEQQLMTMLMRDYIESIPDEYDEDIERKELIDEIYKVCETEIRMTVKEKELFKAFYVDGLKAKEIKNSSYTYKRINALNNKIRDYILTKTELRL